jgi:hypothetical protein
VNIVPDTIINVPSGNPDLPDLRFDLATINHIESRKSEVAYVNKDTAHELMAVFNEGYGNSRQIMAKVAMEIQKVQQEIRKRKAVVLLDIVPDELKRRNLSTPKAPTGSEDFRTAILNLDEMYNKLLDRCSALEAFYELMAIKAKGLEMAYQAVKKIFDIEKSMSSVTTKLNAPSSSDIGVAKYNF